MTLRKGLLLLLAATASVHAQTAPAITFSEHIAPIVWQNCASCHRTGEAAPFTLMSFDDVQRRGRMIAAVTGSGYMPPWKAHPSGIEYVGERRLSPREISWISQWVAGGMPQGDPAKTPPLPSFPSGWQLGTPDLIIEMPEAFTVPAEGADIYRNFAIPLRLTQDKWVRAIEIRPTARSVAHHVLFSHDTSGQAVAADAADPAPGFRQMDFIRNRSTNEATGSSLGGWAVGNQPQFFPQGLALPLPKGSDLVLQYHFHPSGKEEREKSVIGIYFAQQPPKRTLMGVQVPPVFGALSGVAIPAGEHAYMVRNSFVLPADVEGVTVGAHAHYLARDMKLTATLPNGSLKTLLWINDWDFAWQDRYSFQEFQQLPKGTRLDAEILWDNSASNSSQQFSPPRRITWGEESTDEMGALTLNFVPKNEADVSLLKAALQQQLLTALINVEGRNQNRPKAIGSGIVNAASSLPGALAPGEIISIYGNNLGPVTPLAASVTDGRYPAELGGTRVLINGSPAILLMVSARQVNAVVPWSLENDPAAQVEIFSSAGRVGMIAIAKTTVMPAFFTADGTGQGQVAALNQNNAPNSPQAPAAIGGIVQMFATGAGLMIPSSADGVVAANALARIARQARVWIGGVEAAVEYAGVAPGLIGGIVQVNARVPQGVVPGPALVEMEIDSVRSQPGVVVFVK